MDYKREHALLLMMQGQQTWQSNNRISEQFTVAGFHAPFQLPQTCRFDPGRRHLPAELGGRIAVGHEPQAGMSTLEGSAAKQAAKKGFFQPLEFDHTTLTYTGTILWDLDSRKRPVST
jgi:hypothetical protein